VIKHAFTLLLLAGCATTSRSARSGFEVYTFTHSSTNAHVVVQDGASFLFDTGYEKNASKLDEDLRAAGIDPAKLKAVIISHGHGDHAGGALYFHQRYGVPVIIGEGDQGMYTTGKMEPLCPTGLIGNLRHREDEGSTYSPSAPDTIVPDTLDLKELTGIDAKVIRLPGHTNGSMIVVLGDVALVGDLFRGSIVGSGAETHFYQCDLDLNRKNVAKLLSDLAPNAQVFFVGHFGPVSRESVSEHFKPSLP
jgi:glyoxylase-like metal-dependent hydrolase (beta-lactamase superfamily II)